jgi:iron complex outermembrane receptor protein
VFETDYSIFGARGRELEPETIDTHEVVWERYAGGWLRTSVAAYRNQVRQLITGRTPESVDFELDYENSGEVRARGLETEAEVRLTSGLRAEASYVWQDARDAIEQVRLTNSPRHAGRIRFDLTGPARSTLAAGVVMMSGRDTLAGDPVEGVTLASATVRVPLRSGLVASASVHNLFNRRYADPASEEHPEVAIAQDGRTLRVGLEWRLGVR